VIARALDETLVPWVLALRWVVILVLVSSLPATTELLELHVHVPVIVATLAVLVAVNLGHRRLARALPAALRRHALFLNVAIDLVAITVFLAASGGAANPFSSILLVYVALGAALLPARAAFALAGLAALSFGALFLTPAESACCQEPVAPAFSNHLYGMWVAFILGACLVAFFVSRVRHAIEARDRELAELTARAERADKFAAVGTLAAGTAHELGDAARDDQRLRRRARVVARDGRAGRGDPRASGALSRGPRADAPRSSRGGRCGGRRPRR
jgi:two-component system sensor histidine kinase RegB